MYLFGFRLNWVVDKNRKGRQRMISITKAQADMVNVKQFGWRFWNARYWRAGLGLAFRSAGGRDEAGNLIRIVFLSLLFGTLTCAQVKSQNSLLVLPAPTPHLSAASVPRFIEYNGTAKDSDGKLKTGAVTLTLSLYERQEDNTPLWREAQQVSTDGSGKYSVLLGSTQPEGLPAEVFQSTQAHWLGVQVENEPEGPRTLLLSVPYAFKAGDAETLGGLPSSAFTRVGSKADVTASESQTSSNSSTSPSNGKAAVIVGGTGTTSGTGTTNFIPKWTSSTGLGNSAIFQNTSGNVGIGTANPSVKLHVSGGTIAAVASGSIGFGTNYALQGYAAGETAMVLENTEATYGRYWGAVVGGTGTYGVNTLRGTFFLNDFTGGGIRLLIDTSGNTWLVPNGGNVGIGTTTPSAKLDVAGMVKIEGRGNGITFPDGTAQSTALAGGPAGPQGPPGPVGPQGAPGPPAHTSAVCKSNVPLNLVGSGCSSRTVSFNSVPGGSCQVTADTGSCLAASTFTTAAVCSVCAP